MDARVLLLGSGLAIALAACEHDAYDRARDIDTPEAYSRALRTDPNGRGSDNARLRLAELRFEEARKAHTTLAYKRFLEDFPTSEQATQARKLLEGLRFATAETENDPRAYAEFLRDHPDGAHAAEARERLERMSYEHATKEHTLAAMRDFVARFPESSRRVEAERLQDDLAFEEAQSHGAAGISEYLQQATDGAHRDQARALLLTDDAEARAAAGDMVGAIELARRLPGPGAQALVDRLSQDELGQVAALLDPDALKTFASSHTGAPAQEALALVQDIQKRGKAIGPLKASATQLDPDNFARPVDELIRTLSATDPRDRWLAAEELGQLGALPALDPLLNALTDSRFEEVRLRSFTALTRIIQRLGPAAAEVESRRRIQALRKMASGSHLFLKLAMIEDLSGNPGAARGDYDRSLRNEEQELMAVRRLLQLQLDVHAYFDAAITARRLAVEIDEVAQTRARSGDDADPPLLSARWYCGLVHHVEGAEAALASLPPESARDFPEDYIAFQQKVDAIGRQLTARLHDAEDLARADKAGFHGCADDDVMPRMAEGVQARLTAIQQLRSSGDALAIWPLRRAARADPASEVRVAATQALTAFPSAATGPAASARNRALETTWTR